MQEILSTLLAKLDALAPQQRLMLGITGYPGAGKSTISEWIVNEVNKAKAKEVAMVVPMDGYHLSNEVLEQKGLRHLKGIPDTFDAAGFVKLLEKLRETPLKVVKCPRFDRSIEASIEDDIVINPEHRLLVVEGNYLLYDKEPWNNARDCFDEVWFLNVSIETIYPRLVERHVQGGKNEQQAKEKVESTDLPNARLIEKTRPRAHRLVNPDLQTPSLVAEQPASSSCA